MERDYILGTTQEEVARLGLQHRVWRPATLSCWQRAGIKSGSRVIDVGCGPGYATVDLAEIVGPSGSVIACERSQSFLSVAKSRCAAREIENVEFYELDFMEQDIPAKDADFAWTRWVACFVIDPELLVGRIAAALRDGGRAIFHEYSDYRAWRLAPRRPVVEEFVHEVIHSWRDAGGEPDIALSLPHMLGRAGMKLVDLKPLVFTAFPHDYIWEWPKAFIVNNIARLVELGKMSQDHGDTILREFAEASADPLSVLTTPTVFEIVAEKR